MLGAWGGRGALWKGKRSHREWSMAVLKPWRAPYGVALRSACHVLLVGGEPWSVWKWRRWLLFSAGGLEGWLQWMPQGRKGDHRLKLALRSRGNVTPLLPAPPRNLDTVMSLEGGNRALEMEADRGEDGCLALPHSATPPRLHFLGPHPRRSWVCRPGSVCHHQCLYIYRSTLTDPSSHVFRHALKKVWVQMSMPFSQLYLEFVLM